MHFSLWFLDQKKWLSRLLFANPTQRPNTRSKDRLSPRQTGLCGHSWAEGRYKPGGGEGAGVKRTGGGMGKTWEPNTGWSLAKDLKAQGLKMTSQVAWEDLCLVCSKTGAKIIFLWLTFGCTAISHPGEGISCLVTYFRKSSLLPRDNKQHGEGKISQGLHFSTQTSLAQHQVPRRGFLSQTAHFCPSLHCSGCSSHVSGFGIPVPALPLPGKSYMAFLSSGPHSF